MTPPDLETLKRLAKKAEPGPWYEDSDAVWQGDPDNYSGSSTIICDAGNAPKVTLEYIAAADPATVLWLVEQAEEAARLRAGRTDATIDDLPTTLGDATTAPAGRGTPRDPS